MKFNFSKWKLTPSKKNKAFPSVCGRVENGITILFCYSNNIVAKRNSWHQMKHLIKNKIIGEKRSFENYRFSRTILLNKYKYLFKIPIIEMAGKEEGRHYGTFLLYKYYYCQEKWLAPNET